MKAIIKTSAITRPKTPIVSQGVATANAFKYLLHASRQADNDAGKDQ